MDFTPENELGLNLLATGSRDRFIHVYDAQNEFNVMVTLDDHSSSVLALKFAYLSKSKNLFLLSCALDKSILFRQYQFNVNSQMISQNQKVFQVLYRFVDKIHRFYCLELSEDNEILYAGQEKQISCFSTSTGKLVDITETKDVDKDNKIISLDNLKLSIDSSGSYMACANNDKTIRIRETSTGNVVSTLNVGDQITGISFSFNNKVL